MKPNGEAPESTPAATSPAAGMFGEVGVGSGSRFGGWREPMIAWPLLLNMFHCTPNSRLA